MNQFDDDSFFDENEEEIKESQPSQSAAPSELDRIKMAVNRLKRIELIMALIQNQETGSLITKEFVSLDKYNYEATTAFVRRYNNRLFYIREIYYDMTEGEKENIPYEISYDLKELMIFYNRREESKLDPGYKYEMPQVEPVLNSNNGYNNQQSFNDYNPQFSETSTLSTIAIVFAFISPLISIILAIVGIKKYKNPVYKKRCKIAIILAIVIFAISFAYQMWYINKYGIDYLLGGSEI